MKIGIILNRVNYEEKQIIQSLEKYGHEVVQFNNQNLQFYLDYESKEGDQDFQGIDLVLQRSLSLMRGLYTSAILESKGVKVINDYNSTRISGDKLLTTLKLVENGISTPKTGIAFTPESTIKTIENIIGYPTVIKPIIGSWGRMIAKLENRNMATAVLEDRETMGNILQKIYYVQEFIGDDDRPENAPTDIRVIYIDGQCVAAMGRVVQNDDFRSNIALGAKGIKLEIDPEMESICKKIAGAVGGEILGIDLMKTNKGYMCLEVNGTPQFRGISTTTNIDIGQKIIEYINEKYS